jgi:pyruvate/2-oxoglutarate/acetoin dehydrogenase E1 component
LIVEDVQAFCSISSEIMAQIIEKTSKNNLIVKRLNLPNYPVPSNEILEKQYFIDADRIYN